MQVFCLLSNKVYYTEITIYSRFREKGGKQHENGKQGTDKRYQQPSDFGNHSPGGKDFRAALAKKSGLTKATVSAIVLELMQKKLVIEVGSDDTSMGRKPILLTFNASCGHVLSIDLNVDVIAAMTSNLLGKTAV